MSPLHRLTHLTVGVPDVAAVAAFYRAFGLEETAPGCLASATGGEQLRLVPAPRRCLVELGLGVDDSDDIERFAATLTALGMASERANGAVTATEPASQVRVVVAVAEPITDASQPSAAVSRPPDARAPFLSRMAPVRPQRLGHVVVGTPDYAASRRFFEQLGFRVSDEVVDVAVFLRCSSDHHNLLVQRAPVAFLHHSSWRVADVDEVGRGAKAMLATDPSRHVWGLGRHWVGSNFFWYLRDPAGNFAEYYADMDVILDDQLWQPGVFADERALYAWGPPPPPSFIAPDDLAELMAR